MLDQLQSGFMPNTWADRAIILTKLFFRLVKVAKVRPKCCVLNVREQTCSARVHSTPIRSYGIGSCLIGCNVPRAMVNASSTAPHEGLREGHRHWSSKESPFRGI